MLYCFHAALERLKNQYLKQWKGINKNTSLDRLNLLILLYKLDHKLAKKTKNGENSRIN